MSFTVDGVSVTQGFGAVPLGSGDDAIVNPDEDADSAERTTGASHGLGRGRHAGVDYLYAAGSVREFRVGADGYSAQVSGAGNVLSAVTRQGGDKVHGSAFFRIRSSALAAKDPLAIATSYADGAVASGEVKPHDLRESFGGTFGGPTGTYEDLRCSRSGTPRFPCHFLAAGSELLQSDSDSARSPGESRRVGFSDQLSPELPFFSDRRNTAPGGPGDQLRPRRLACAAKAGGWRRV